MLVLDNRTPYAAERNWVRDPTGAHHWVVAVKATFDIAADGRLRLADEQPPPLVAPEHWGEPGLSSLRYEADLGPAKPNTDVLVNGNAVAPRGRPVAELPVALRLPGVEKTLVVTGDSVYHQGLGNRSKTSPQPFTTLPIVYERAFGGTDHDEPDAAKRSFDLRNPVGTGFAVHPSQLANRLAPNVLYPGRDPEAAGPAGFGALESFWSPRRELVGTYDAKWVEEQRPFLPKDWDPRSTLCSPVDQRPPQHLRGGELVSVVNMTPEGVLQLTLPKIYLAFTTFFGPRTEEHRSKLATVLLLTEERKLSMVWQSTLAVPLRHMDYLDRTLIKQKPYLT